MKATSEAHVLAMLEDARRALYAARHERRDGEDTRVMSVEDWETVRDAVLARAARLGDAVPEGVNLGYHLCYGDVAEKHFKEPHDTANLTRVANGLFERVNRRVDFVHMPVPIGRHDEEYFAPLKDLRLPEGARLYLGLLHREDGLEGAQRRMRAAATAVSAFGVATECGMGRGPREDMEPLLKLHSQAVRAAESLT